MDLHSNFTPWDASRSDTVLAAIAKFEKLREGQIAVRTALCKEVDAKGWEATSSGILAFQFDEKPKDWQCHKSYGFYRPPKGTHMNILRRRMREAPLADWGDFHDMLDAGAAGIGPSGRPTGFLILTCRYERLGAAVILWVPKDSEFKPADCQKLRPSEYHRIKETVEAAA